nr:MAG TPA: hypothetical protein [Bacteriophage sp.]
MLIQRFYSILYAPCKHNNIYQSFWFVVIHGF